MRFLLILLLSSLAVGAAGRDYVVKPAKGDATARIQRAVDRCSASGGGRVTMSAGNFVSGTILLKDNVELHLSKGATLYGSTDHPRAYAAGRGIIVGKGVSRCAVTGLGCIDGNGRHEVFQQFGNNQGDRPHAIFFEDCRDVRVTGISIRDAAWWTLRLFRCDGVSIDGVNIYCQAIVNNDGIDVDARNVTIANCIIDSEDDGICLKSNDSGFMPENIVVTNCIIASNCNPIKLGTASAAGFRNISVSNCVIRPASESNVWNWPKKYRALQPGTITGLSGIAVESVDGGTIENISFSNIVMSGVISPILVCLNKRGGKTGRISNVRFSNITATCHGILPAIVSGIPGGIIEGISLRDITLNLDGLGTADDAATEPRENMDGYPENRMYGHSNPAAALYLRHCADITVDNLHVNYQRRDARPDIVAADANGLKIEASKTVAGAGREPAWTERR